MLSKEQRNKQGLVSAPASLLQNETLGLSISVLSGWCHGHPMTCQVPVCSSLQYDFVELLDGSRLIAREQRNLLESERAGRQARSVSLHEAGFIQYLDSGIWHLAFYNDGKNAEQVSFNTIIIGKHNL